MTCGGQIDMIETGNMLVMRKVSIGWDVALIAAEIFHLVPAENGVFQPLSVCRCSSVLEEARVRERQVLLACRHGLPQR